MIAQAATSDTPDYTQFHPLNTQADFHPFCWVTDYNNQTNVEQCWLGDENLTLVDVNTEDDAVVQTMHDFVKGLVSNFSADGVRIDTVKHIRKDFWPGFASAAGVYTIGEVLNNETSYIQPYSEVLDAVLDYSTWFPLVAAFQTQYGNCSALAAQAQAVQSTYKNGAFGTGSFLENHDQPRFASLSNDSTVSAGVHPRVMVRRLMGIRPAHQERDCLAIHLRRHPDPLLRYVSPLDAWRVCV